ncbi:RagB/SusD family nutrient uptake outer membrane protein [Butyricimonas faecalis]|uniref:RagB/SusD family nutrient uptake outer membrane protein n=1 Tax=Butyricimonas faecalis TaxID=2093856 RepID=A0A3S9VX72_9BACT|nr:RagB/SusD family nutrient uptake outer membrane protein [Butyricimonas faecalis]AZS31125.1 RagB/SusD family nutrient uptake outer membrane protein [Butyricimonas faecalis]
MKRLLFFFIISFFLLSACDNWLDVVPEEDLTTIDTDFETRDEAETWLRSCYVFLQEPFGFSTNIAFTGADEVVGDDYARNLGYIDGLAIGAGLQNVLNPYGDIWLRKGSYEGTPARSDFYTAIATCNIFIDKIDQVYNMEEIEKREWKAEVKAVKAYYYFELVRHYGPIILVPENIDRNVPVEEMKVPRSHVDTCFKAIVRLCDEAAEVLPIFNDKSTERRCYFNKEAALALKARALAYQASPLFNGNPDYTNFVNKNGEPLFSTTVDKEKWRLAAEAAEVVIELCKESGKKLVDNQTAVTPLQTHMANIEASVQTFNYTSDEALLMIKTAPYDYDMSWQYYIPSVKNDPNKNLPGTCLSPSMKMVEMFYTENGLPISQDPAWIGSGNPYNLGEETDPKYTDVVMLGKTIPNLHRRREPRFYASIASDRTYWRLGRTTSSLQEVVAYQGENFGLQAKRITSTIPQNLTGYWVKKWSCSKVELYTYSSGLKGMGTAPYPVIRLAEMYLIAAEAWNEYGGNNAKVYKNLNVIRKRAGIPDVEVSWKNAKDKSKVTEQNGLREIIQQEWNVEFAFEGMRFWNLRRWKTANIELNEKLYGWNVAGNRAETFYNNGKGPVIVYSGNTFVAPRDYFWPIRSEEAITSGCVQNPGW